MNGIYSLLGQKTKCCCSRRLVCLQRPDAISKIAIFNELTELLACVIL